jgi:hypothetical protein
MAHFAQLDENNVVLQVIVVNNKDTSDAFGVEKEHIGAAFCERLLGGRWIQTSYNGNIRKIYAGKGMVYLKEHGHFADPKPSDDHVYDPENGEWYVPGMEDDKITVDNVGENNG